MANNVSDSQDKILDALKDGEFHSGESLGDILGVSRTAVWKQLQKLEEIGLQVESVKGTGYRVVNGIDLLKKDDISAISEKVTAINRALLSFFRASIPPINTCGSRRRNQTTLVASCSLSAKLPVAVGGEKPGLAPLPRISTCRFYGILSRALRH